MTIAVEGSPPGNALSRVWGNAQFNARGGLSRLFRPSRDPGRPLPIIGGLLAWYVAILVLVAVTALLKFGFDGFVISAQRGSPQALIEIFAVVTRLGNSAWILWPTGLALIALSLASSPRVGTLVQATAAALAVRIGFVFICVAGSGTLVALTKYTLGRARPVHFEQLGAIEFVPFMYQSSFASFPSGHSTTAFAFAVAMAFLLPRWRVPLLIVAAAVAASRVIVGAHWPSDVVVGAAWGTFFVLLTRRWFAHRRLGFVVTREGAIRTKPLPWRALRRLAGLVVDRPRRPAGAAGGSP